ncbi:hypothetical protein P8452_55831 [Trifolium repens]|nr:hypothetical protein P8452_55831 [Trifolium repens]
MSIIGLGLLLFALLIGNIQNFLQALGRRRLEMQLRGRDVEQWMSHRRLPEDLKKRVRQAERWDSGSVIRRGCLRRRTYLEQSSENKEGNKVKLQGQGLTSDITVRCLTNVEAFSLRTKDIEEVTTLFARFLRSRRVQGVIRYESPYWRSLAANRIQVGWRYRKKRLSRANTTQNDYQTLKSWAS